jgi:N-acetylglucosaminyldiphosphoundecaprenol N-acetyl-beta-D-mannosaminyltransferase
MSMEAALKERSHNEQRVEILGLGIDQVDMEGALNRIEEFIAEGAPRIVVTADASGLVAAQSDQQWRSIIENADLVTPDSVGVIWASERTGNVLKSRVSGVDLVAELCRLSAEKGYRIYFLGAAPGVAEKAASALRLKFPGVNIVGARDGYFSEAEERSVVTAIREAKPDVLFVAMGIPIQEKFIVRHMYEIGAPVSMGVGGSFDVLSGNVRRAPVFIQRARLEWVWRLLMNPKKWRKVVALPKFWWLVMRQGRQA